METGSEMLIWPLGLPSPGAATDGVTPIFSWKNCHFLRITVNFIDFTHVSPTPFSPVRPLYPLLFVSSAHIFYSGGR